MFHHFNKKQIFDNQGKWTLFGCHFLLKLCDGLRESSYLFLVESIDQSQRWADHKLYVCLTILNGDFEGQFPGPTPS